MLFVIGAMAALSVDVVSLYTARSEAQMAADSAALAAARVLANSGATSDPTGVVLTSVESAGGPAAVVATQVAEQNQVGGTKLTAANITAIAFGGPNTNPTVTVSVQVTNLPTFFARIWGVTQLTARASATAEAYNPSGATALGTANPKPVAPICVKPWLLPNMDPKGGTTIFDPTTGAITDPNLLGWTSTSAATRLSVACTGGNCSGTLPNPAAWKYYPGDPATTFLPPTQALPTCAPALTTSYEQSIAGCIQTSIACNANPATNPVNIDTSDYPTRNSETRDAVNCLTHSNANQGDSVDPAYLAPPFEFLAGNDNPIPGLAGSDVMVSDSLVTVPVFNSNVTTPPTSPVTIVGFVQLFLNPDGLSTHFNGHVNTTVINMVGCGIGWTSQTILGNGASPVTVRLISPSS